MAETTTPEIIQLKPDMTIQWPCRRGDFLLWLRYDEIFSGPDSIRCYDLWEMRDGNSVKITNRLEDLPPWFKLHPTEVCDSFVYRMTEQVEKGDYPEEPVNGPNLWRLRSGDRVVWVGLDRTERRAVNVILSILDFKERALAIGEGDWATLKDFAGFGAPTTQEMRAEDVARCQAAVKRVKEMGLPRTWGPKWMLGYD
jgi:hypothetical protein